MQTTVYFRGTRAEARGSIRRGVAMLVGKEPDSVGIKNGVALAVGFACLSDVKDAFIEKARGGTGEDGVRWAPLSPAYLAYGRRFGPGEQAALKGAAGLGKGNRHAPGTNKGLLTADEKKRWQKIYGGLLQRFMLSMPVKEAKAKAAAIAWNKLKAQGAQTKINIFGGRTVEILRDTGVLFNSLSPGVLSEVGPNATYTKPSGNGGDEQVFDVLDNGVIVGTNVSYAAVHQDGSAKKNIPARPFLPMNGQVPAVWWQRWAEIANQALLNGLSLALRVKL